MVSETLLTQCITPPRYINGYRRPNAGTSSPGPSPRRFSKWRIVGRRRRFAILKIVEEKALGTRLNAGNNPAMD